MIVKNTASGEIVHSFQMDQGVVVREVFILDNGKTIAASQKDHAVFWDLATGKEIARVNQRVYGFSHDETKFFTYKYPEGMFLYRYPELRQICALVTKRMPPGPFNFLFSPDDRFLIVWCLTGFPSSDQNYPRRNNVRSALACAKLYELQICQEIKEFSKLRAINSEGAFFPDSQFYYFQKARRPSPESEKVPAIWQFDLTTYSVSQIEANSLPVNFPRRKKKLNDNLQNAPE